MFKFRNIIGNDTSILELISAILIPIGCISLFFGISGIIVKFITHNIVILCVLGLIFLLIGLIIEKWKDYNG